MDREEKKSGVFYKISFDDKLRVETKLEIEDDKISKAGSYTKFISHLKLILEKCG